MINFFKLIKKLYFNAMETTTRDINVFIEGLRRNNFNATQIHGMIVVAFGENIISKRRVQEIVKEFSCGVRQTFDRIDGSGRSISDKRKDLQNAVRIDLQQDPHTSIRRLAAVHDTSYCMMYQIVTEDLQCMSVSNRFVPHKLSDVNKLNRVECCKEILKTMNSRNALKRLIHTDEKWIFCSPMGNPKTRTSWVLPGGDIPTVAKRSTVQAKFMILVACNFDGLFYSKTLNKGTTVDSNEYVAFLKEAFNSFSAYDLQQQRRALIPENCIIQQDNARPHVAANTKNFLNNKNCGLLKQPEYSPDTNLLDRFIFPKLEMERAHLELNTQHEVQTFVDEHLRKNTPEILERQFEKLKEHCQNVIDNLGNYVIY